MSKFRKKPVVIEAHRFGYGTPPEWLGDRYNVYGTPKPGDVVDHGDSLDIHTLEGVMVARTGDWIIRGVKGELYPCKPAIFEATYEAVEP